MADDVVPEPEWEEHKYNWLGFRRIYILVIAITGFNAVAFFVLEVIDRGFHFQMWAPLFYFALMLSYIALYFYLKSSFVDRGASLKVSRTGVVSFSRFGKTEVTWDNVRRVKMFGKPGSKPFLLHFETNKGDFLVYKWRFPHFREFVDTVKRYAGDRIVPMEGSRWKLNMETPYECSRCGGQFVAIACTFCEVPRTKREEHTRSDSQEPEAPREEERGTP